MLRLYTYFRSSASYRLRIALALKGLGYESVPVHLLKDGGEQHSPAYRAVNPAGLVPVLQDGDAVLTQSVAIMEYLDEAYPEAPLLPADLLGRARVRALLSPLPAMCTRSATCACSTTSATPWARATKGARPGPATGSRSASRRSKRC